MSENPVTEVALTEQEREAEAARFILDAISELPYLQKLSVLAQARSLLESEKVKDVMRVVRGDGDRFADALNEHINRRY